MKKAIIGLIVFCAFSGMVFAGMDHVEIPATLSGTQAQTNQFVINGTICRVECDFYATAGTGTNVVSLVNASGNVVFTNAFTADAGYNIGSTLTDYTGTTATNWSQYIWVKGFPSSGKLTLYQNQLSPITTNTYKTKIVYEK